MIQIGAVLALTILADSYNRSHVQTTNTTQVAHCLYWPAGTITYNQNMKGDPSVTDGGLTVGTASDGTAAFDAARAAFSSWEGVMLDGGNLRFSEGAQTSSTEIGYLSDGGANQNILIYRTQGCDSVVPAGDVCREDNTCNNKYDCWDNDSATIALTTTTYDVNSGREYDADIELNWAGFYFTTASVGPVCSTRGQPDCIYTDIQNTLTHEIGHFIGLDHDYVDPDSTMNPSATPGDLQKRNLDDGSIQFVKDVYPAGGASRDCVIVATQAQLGAATGCSAAPGLIAGGAFAGVVLLLMRRRRT